MKNRESGYYWVKKETYDKLEVARYIDEYFKWKYWGKDFIKDDFFYTINETKIQEPK